MKEVKYDGITINVLDDSNGKISGDPDGKKVIMTEGRDWYFAQELEDGSVWCETMSYRELHPMPELVAKFLFSLID